MADIGKIVFSTLLKSKSQALSEPFIQSSDSKHFLCEKIGQLHLSVQSLSGSSVNVGTGAISHWAAW